MPDQDSSTLMHFCSFPLMSAHHASKSAHTYSLWRMYSVQLHTYRHQCVYYMHECIKSTFVLLCILIEWRREGSCWSMLHLCNALVCCDEFEQAGGGGGGRFRMHMGREVEGGGSWDLVWRLVWLSCMSQALSPSVTYPCLGKHPH